MSQPLDRTCKLPALGEVDEAAGEFWVANPFMMPMQGDNLSAYERNCLFVNVAGRDFIDASFASSADIDSDSRTAITADFDGDGATDILVGSVGGGPLRLFRNQMQQGQSLTVELCGTTSNRAGIGARLIARIGDRQIVRDVFPAGGFLGVGPALVTLGLADAESVDSLTVRWPTGTVQEFSDISAGQRIVITESKADIAN